MDVNHSAIEETVRDWVIETAETPQTYYSASFALAGEHNAASLVAVADDAVSTQYLEVSSLW